MATIPAGNELDPLFLKAIALLRSKHPDSTSQLKDLVNEYREKTHGTNAKKISDITGHKSPHFDIATNKSQKSQISSKSSKEYKISPIPLTMLEKLEEVTNLNEQIEESVEEITLGSSLEPKLKKQKTNTVGEITSHTHSDSSDANDSIPLDQIIEMDFDGPMCKICHLSKQSEEENSLVECSECHLYFHQKCHKPHVSTKDLNDPRLIWYCLTCTKKIRKEMAAQQSSNTVKPGTEPAPKLISNPFQQAKPFRRLVVPNSDKAGNSSIPTQFNEAVSAPLESSRESSPSPLSNKQRPRDATVNSMKRLELVKKRAKIQQQLKQARK